MRLLSFNYFSLIPLKSTLKRTQLNILDNVKPAVHARVYLMGLPVQLNRSVYVTYCLTVQWIKNILNNFKDVKMKQIVCLY